MRDRCVVCYVVGMTLLWALGAIVIMLWGPTPPSLFSERLFETFVSLTAAGFFTILGLLATEMHGKDARQRPENSREGG